MDRRKIYFNEIIKGINRILNIQVGKGKYKGSFFGQEASNYFNSRWQEAVLSLAWAYKNKIRMDIADNIVNGINFWFCLQHKDGSFPELSKMDRSYAATAFGSYAIIEAIDIMGTKDLMLKYMNNIVSAARWLSKNEEPILTNQESAACIFLYKTYKLTGKQEFFTAYKKKLNNVLSNQTSDGDYKERNGFDIGYSSITADNLSSLYLLNKDEQIKRSVLRYISLVKHFLNPDGTIGGMYNKRKNGWLILNPFEIFCENSLDAKYILSKMLDSYKNNISNIFHLPDDRHLCTDLYRLCFAYSNCNTKLTKTKLKLSDYELVSSNIKLIRRNNYVIICNKSNSKLYSLWTPVGLMIFARLEWGKDNSFMKHLRFIGFHRIRKYFMLYNRLQGYNCNLEYNSRIKIIFKSKVELVLSFDNLTKVSFDSNTIKFRKFNRSVDIRVSNIFKIRKLEKISLKDSVFYGDKALNYIILKSNKGILDLIIK